MNQLETLKDIRYPTTLTIRRTGLSTHDKSRRHVPEPRQIYSGRLLEEIRVQPHKINRSAGDAK